jgi:hypothetical protein
VNETFTGTIAKDRDVTAKDVASVRANSESASNEINEINCTMKNMMNKEFEHDKQL